MTANPSALLVTGLVSGPRFISSRTIEAPPRHGEKPFAQLVDEAFDGAVIRLSEKLRLLEEADRRHIRRGDAIDAIESTRRRLEERYAVRHQSALHLFFKRYACFAAGYMLLAIAWCFVVAMH